jgi:hypothetical protein
LAKSEELPEKKETAIAEFFKSQIKVDAVNSVEKSVGVEQAQHGDREGFQHQVLRLDSQVEP